MKDLALLAIVGFFVIVAVIMAGESKRDPLPLVHAAASGDCPRLPNPCDTVNCHKRPKERIA